MELEDAIEDAECLRFPGFEMQVSGRAPFLALEVWTVPPWRGHLLPPMKWCLQNALFNLHLLEAVLPSDSRLFLFC